MDPIRALHLDSVAEEKTQSGDDTGHKTWNTHSTGRLHNEKCCIPRRQGLWSTSFIEARTIRGEVLSEYLCSFCHLLFKLRLCCGVLLHKRLVGLCGFFGFHSSLQNINKTDKWLSLGYTLHTMGLCFPRSTRESAKEKAKLRCSSEGEKLSGVKSFCMERSVTALHQALLPYHDYVGACMCECDLPPCPHLSGWPPLCGGAPAPRFWHCRSPWTSAEPERWSGCSERPPGWTPPPLSSSNTQMFCIVTQLTTG